MSIARYLSLIGFAVLSACTGEAFGKRPIDFERDVAPILRAKCVRCHSVKKLEGELDLGSLAGILRGGASGVAVVKGRPAASLLIQRVLAEEMPPKGATRLNPAEKKKLQEWIAAGLPAKQTARVSADRIHPSDRLFWSFRSLRRPPVPQTKLGSQLRTPIDAFILARLEAKQLRFSPAANPGRLIRRLYFDLIGLPPSPTEVAAFLQDRSPIAYERLVDRLLASPHFGERWGRHWLDTVGYTDVVSYDGDTNFIPGFIQGRWRYRDYVISSLNDDTPFNRFLAEQVAGDEFVGWRTAKRVTPRMRKLLAATGFWRNAEDRSASAKELEYKWSLLHDTMQTFGTSVLGLTLRCARCHSHKHEPIPQENYYQLLSLVTPAFNIQSWKTPPQRAVPTVTQAKKKKIEATNAALTKRITSLQNQIKQLKKAKLDGPKRKKLTEINQAIAQATAEKKSYGWIQAVYDVGPPPDTHLLVRGDFKRPGRKVQPGFLSVLSQPGQVPRIQPGNGSSGRRTALARWLTANGTPASSLVARVQVNRIWQRLTGVGIVPSSENLGRSGDRPTHPNLLEWLASDFVESGWQVKLLIRKIVLSSVYRQTSRPPETSRTKRAEKTDPGNKLLWRFRLRRLESEAIRDAMLVVSGAFDARLSGPAVKLHYRKDGLVSFDEKTLKQSSDKWRRSVYLFHRRVYHLTVLGVFDQPVVAGATCRRNSSAVALQSLSMLNDDMVLATAKHFARRVYRVAGKSPRQQVTTAFQLALGRTPSRDEHALGLRLLGRQEKLYRQAVAKPVHANTLKLNPQQQALMHLCRVLLNTSEFLYIE